MGRRWIMWAAVAAVLVVPGPAQAGTLSFTGDVLTYTGAPLEQNSVSFTRGVEAFNCTARPAPCLMVQEAGDASFGSTTPRCTVTDEIFKSAECEIPASIVVNVGDAVDSVSDWDGPSTINGGPGDETFLRGNGGDDTINGGPGNDGLFGGPGNDTLDGGDGNDRFEGYSGGDTNDPTVTVGTDVYIGGPGDKDWVDYEGRTDPLTVSLDGAANDGAAGEADNAGADVEQVRGGSAADTLVGSAARNELDGAGGDDTLRGGGGEDTLFGREGNDRTAGEDGQDTIEGGDGNDEVDGGAGTDVLYGDTLQTCIPGACHLGMDTVLARDGAPDQVYCGPGEDSAVLDGADTVPSSGPDVCEREDRAGGGGGAPGGGGPGGGGGPAADATAPQVGALRAGRLRLGRSIAIRFTLSEAAQVTIRAERRIRRRGGTRFRKVDGALRVEGAAGDNRLTFRGKVGKRRLKPGRYRLVLVARDAAGNQGPPRRVALRVTR